MSTLKSNNENMTINADGASSEIILQQNATERMCIDSSGNVLVNTTNAGATGLSLSNSSTISFAEGASSSLVNMFRQANSGDSVFASGYKYTGTHNKYASSVASSWAKSAVAVGYGYVRFFTDAVSTDSVGTDLTPTERMRIDSAGHVTMPYQPAFSAKLSTNQSNLATGGVTTILFNTEIFDQNADFNTGTYTFTAPVTGRYQLNVALQINDIDSANTEYIDLWIITSNRTYRTFFDPQQQLNADADYLNLNLSVLADMDTDDTAYVGVKPHSGAAQTDINADYSYFSGYLVC